MCKISYPSESIERYPESYYYEYDLIWKTKNVYTFDKNFDTEISRNKVTMILILLILITWREREIRGTRRSQMCRDLRHMN